MSTTINGYGYGYGRDEDDGQESHPLPDLHPDVAGTFTRQSLDVQRIRWELTQMGLATPPSPDTVSVETTADVDGQVATVTDAQKLRPGQDPAIVRAAVRARASGEAVQEAAEHAWDERAREDQGLHRGARQL